MNRFLRIIIIFIIIVGGGMGEGGAHVALRYIQRLYLSRPP